jgi:hypothetical protein
MVRQRIAGFSRNATSGAIGQIVVFPGTLDS